MTQNSYLAIVDWGIGGLGIHQLIKSRLGNVPVLYFSDTGVTPYGRMSRAELIARLNAVIDFLRSRGVTHVVFGCNAASTVIPLLESGDLKLEGIIESAVRLTQRTQPRRLALIGGRRTVLSGVYRRALAKRGINVEQRIAQPLSALIESGDVSSDTLRRQCQAILAPIKNSSHILLACTHYPAVLPILKECVSPNTVLIDPAAELVNKIKRWPLTRGGADIFLTSGDPQKMKTAAFKAFGSKLKRVDQVTV
ncbi:MAG: Glutamate racemase [Acidobacteria bacterium]|nr:Glutamate racemase [Acidobacteriota bacterium]